jgi:hypothetical protein
VPRISHFNGITIRMYFDESFHPGRPHFHASYGEHDATFDIAAQARLTGKLPPRAERLVRKWARVRKEELLANWDSARGDGALTQVDPLK